jgi:3',5'-cyclic AMP phosphodiesterase CpdA
VELTTVADTYVVFHDGVNVFHHRDLCPGTVYEFHGVECTTLTPPAGELLARVATVNDVHFGEIEAGRIDDLGDGPIMRGAVGEPPYPETMNRAAVREIAALDPDAVIVKGDLTNDGLATEFASFEATYSGFAGRLHTVRGNHDGYRGQTEYAGDQWIELPGIAVALLDTAVAGRPNGDLSDAQIEWLDDHLATADRPVLVMGHHQQWIANRQTGHRSPDYFGIVPDASDALAEVFARRRVALAYTAGHTHRHRVRHMPCGAPSIEIGCVKDFPGTWAEYRIHAGGVLQIVHRISEPAALTWSERCRHLYSDFGLDYASYAMGRLEDRCCNIPLR